MLQRPRVLAVLALLALGVGVTAEDAKKPPLDFPGLKYRLIGPFVGGRAARAAGIGGDPFTYYAATAAGGVWKSTDGGIKWKPIFDEMDISSIGSIAIAPSDPNVIYVGSGEANPRGNVAAGNGIYKSTDAGKTWTHVWKQEGQIGTMVVHPKNSDVAFAAVLGHAFGPNPERGVYRTVDGGKTWQQVLKKDAETGASDVCMDPGNPRILFAGLWQMRRKPWDLVSGGPGSALYASRDGGDTWKELGKDDGIPEGIKGRIGCAVAPSNGQRVYAIIEAEKGGLFRSDNGGESFSLATAHRVLRQRPWYYSTMTVDPKNADVVWFPQVSLVKTIDGGKTLEGIKKHHGDLHDVWIDPTNSMRMITAHDGGVSITTDGGKSWYSAALPIAQLYHVGTDTSVPYRVHGAMQDMGTASGPSNSLKIGGIAAGEWFGIGGGEAGHSQSEPGNPAIVYAGEYLGIFTQYNHKTGQARNVSAYPDNESGHGAGDFKHRFQWTAPILVSPHDPKTVYHGGEVIFKTRDGGQTWSVISPDLTRNDKSKQQWAGGPITGDNTGVEFFGTVFAIAESPLKAGVIWSGSDDGLVQVTQDGGKTWMNVTPNMPKFKDFSTVALIEASPFEAGAAYVVVEGHRLDDMKPYLAKTTDYGKTWKLLSTSMKQDVYVHAVREDPKKRGMLYVGTERGVIFSRDDGATWEPLKLNFPSVAVTDLRVQSDDLVLSTMGRSFWILDNLTSLREWKSDSKNADAILFPTATATAWRYSGNFHDTGVKGQNPPAAAMIEFFLKAKSDKPVSIEILDPKGAVVRTLKSEVEPQEWAINDPDEGKFEEKEAEVKNDAGVQRAFWDFRHEGAKKIWRAKIDEGEADIGPLVAPGAYTVRLNVNGKTQTQPLMVKVDPRVSLSAADYDAQVAFTLGIRDDVTRLTKIVNALRGVRTQVAARKELVKADKAAAEWVKTADALAPKLDALEDKLHNPKAEVTYDILAFKGGAKLYSRIIPLYSFAIDGDGVPTQGMREVYATLKGELDALEKEWTALLGAEIATLNKAAQPAIVIP